MAGRDFSAELFGPSAGRDFSAELFGAKPPEKQSAFRQIADVPLGIAKGAVQGVRMIADAFGAGSDTSKTIKSAETYLADLMSAQAKNDQQEISRIMKDAEDKGVLDQVKAGIKAFTVAPVDTLSSALGTAAPVIAGALGAKLLGAGALATTGVSALTGAGMGAGSIKGSIYEATKQTLKEAGASEQDAESRAKLAQEYGGKNLDQILLGTVLGGAAAVGPLEKGGAAILARRILGKTEETVAGQAAKGAVRRRLEAGALEAVPEAAQAGQEQVAQNIALQREGFDVPTFRGAFSSATLEGLAGAGLGAAVGGGKPAAAPEVPPAAPPVAPPAAPEAGLEQLTPQQKQELERQRAGRERPQTTEELFAGITTAPATTPQDVARIRDEHETAVIEGLLEQDAEMKRASDLAAQQREIQKQQTQLESEAEFISGGISDVDRRVREGRIFARVQDLIDRNIPFASTAINDINQKFGVINEAPLTEEERARIENIMGMVSTFTNFVNLPVLAPKPMDPFAENQQMEALIRERTERGQAQPVRTAPAAPSPSVQEAPVSQGVGEGPAVRPPSGVEPSVAEDSELVTPAPVVEAAAPTIPELRQRVEQADELSDEWQTRIDNLKNAVAQDIKQTLDANEMPVFVSKSGLTSVITPSAQQGGMFQLTRYNQTGAVGDSQYRTIEDAITDNNLQDANRLDKAKAEEHMAKLVEAEAAYQSSKKPAPKAKAPTTKPAKAAALRKQPNTIMGSTMLADVSNRLGGLDLSLLSEFSTKFITKRKDKYGRPLTMWRNPMVPGVGTLFRKGGESDYVLIATMLEEAGYLEPGSVERDYKEAGERAKDMIKAALNREEVLTLEQQESQRQADEEANRQAWLEQQEELKAERDNAAREAGLTPYEGDLLTDEDIDVFAPAKPQTDEQYAAAMRGLGFDETEIADAVQKKQERERAQKTASGRPAEARAVPETGEGTEGLERYTAEEVTRKQEEAEKAAAEEKKAKAAEQARLQKEKSEKEEKARADESVKDFELGKSAEEQMTGMGDLFKGEKKSLGGERAQVQAFEQTLRNLLNKFGLKDVGLKILDGMTDSGSYAAQIIRIAADAANPVRTLRHEAIHALRELGFFTDAQWKSLSKMAKDKWIDQYLKQRNVDGKPLKAGEESRYDAYMREYNGDMEKITEEAVSDAFADFDATKPPAGLIQALLKRMKDLFQSIKSALTKVESPEQIFGKVEKGELKESAREAKGEAKSLRDRATANFRRWFGDSKVVDKKGEPLVVYHGTDEEFYAFDPSKQNVRNARMGMGFYFTANKDAAAMSGDRVMPVYLSLQNPYVISLDGDPKFGSEGYETREKLKRDPVAATKELRAAGYDGIQDGNTYVAFEPTQIKSAIGNNGDYSLTNADIRKSIGGRNPGEQAISIVNQMKMGIPPAKPTFGQQTIAILKGEQQLPTLDLKTAKEVAMKFSDTFEKNIFSADAAFENAVRRGVRKAVKDNDKVIGLVLQAGQSQAVNIDNVVSRAIIEGASEYNEDMQKWQSVQKEENLKAQTAKLEEISKKYNLPLDEVKSVAHAYLVTKRLPGILERNAKFTAEIDAEQKTAKPDRKKIEELKALLVMVTPEQQAQMEPGQSLVKLIPELEQVSDIWQGMRKNTINTMVEGGLWSKEYAESLLDNVDYVPYYRVEQLEEDAGPLEFIRGLQVKAKDHRLKGSDSPVNDVFDNQVRWMQYAMSRTMRAHKARQMIDVAKDIDIGGRKMAVQVKEQERGMNIVRIYRDGKQELWDVADPNFIDAFAAIQNVSIPMFKWAAKAAEILRNMVVLYPLFSVAQVPQDSMAAVFTSGLKPQHALKIPYLAVQEFIKTIAKTSATHNELKKFGVVGARDFSADVMRKDAEIEAGLKQPKGVWGKTKEILEHVAMAGDNAVRQATYIASKQQGLSEKEALEKAFEIFNVRRRGTSKALNLAGQTIPFFYAYLAAQRVAYRTITGVGTSPTQREAALKTLAATSASVMVLSMIYAMMVGDDEDYAETPAAVRDRTLMIPGSGGVRIPLRPDFFLFPKIIAEHTYQLITDKGYEDGAKFRTSMFDALVNAVSSPTPIPQIVKPALGVAINYDFFQGKPLIGTFEKNKDLERQFRDTTSELAKLFGQTGMVSPIAVDHLIRGMLGSFGGLMLYGTNMFLHSDPDVPRPEMSANEMLAALPGTAGFLKRPQESALKNDFFVLRDAVEKAANTFNDIKTRSPEGIEAFLEDEKNAIRLGMAKGVDKINRHLSDIRRRMTIITNMPESQMPADEKAENIRELRELEREILRSVNVKELREMAKI
jgi:hypothetical protein